MKLDFLNRHSELKRLEEAFSGKGSSFVCLCGRRRCSKMRLLKESLKTIISRPISRLQELDYVERCIPFGQSPLKSKLSCYHLKDSFLRFWFRFVEPEMFLLGNLRNKVNQTPFASGAETIRYRLFVLDIDISHPEVISGEHIITACVEADN